jgi:perosamine synthetase
MIPVQRPSLGHEELEAVGKVFESRWLGMGSTVKAFEDALATAVGARHVLAVNTGTSALHLALAALELQPGDEVLVPSLTFVATIQAIIACQLRPVFCDVERDTLNLDVQDAARRVTVRTRVVLPVHYAGLPCDMDAVLELARARGLVVVEDAAHAFGSTYRGRPIGVIGHVTCFSFDPIKNITCGEGGAVATDDAVLAKRVEHRRMLGISNDTWSRYRGERNWFYEVISPGYRYHLSNINAAIGLVQLGKAPAFRTRKVDLVRRYDEALRGVPGLELLRHDYDSTFPFCYVVKVPAHRREAMIKFLKERGVGSGVHYIPNHMQPLFLRFATPLPVTDEVFPCILTLPLFFEMTDEEQATVVRAVREFLDG